jgi:DNA-binding MarR family transcriptional regulator
MLLHLVPTLFNTRELTILEGELAKLPSQKIENLQIEDELFDILNFIYHQNQNNTLVTFSDIGKKFLMVRATIAKKLRFLENDELITIKKHGRSKTLYITSKGKELLDKRQTV